MVTSASHQHGIAKRTYRVLSLKTPFGWWTIFAFTRHTHPTTRPCRLILLSSADEFSICTVVNMLEETRALVVLNLIIVLVTPCAVQCWGWGERLEESYERVDLYLRYSLLAFGGGA